jgi:biopolymer transport protein ExbB
MLPSASDSSTTRAEGDAILRPGLFVTLILTAALAISGIIYTALLPDYIKAGGPLVIVLMALSIMVAAFVIERLLALQKAQGRGSLPAFIKRVQAQVEAAEIEAAIQSCHAQRGSCANIMRAGLEKFRSLRDTGDPKVVQQEIQAAMQESMMLEVPLLERNLSSISTIASISTLVGLLGTTLGMIRSFKALAKSGAPDAIALSLGISEALVNTAGGLLVAITGIIAYNYFFNRIDDFTYTIDEAANYAMVQSLVEKTLDLPATKRMPAPLADQLAR